MKEATDTVLRILGFAMIVPPKKSFATFDEKLVKNLIDNVERRYSEEGRMRFARSICRDLTKFGYKIAA